MGQEQLRLQESPAGITAGNRSAPEQVALDPGPISGSANARSAEAALKRTIEVLQGDNGNDSEDEDQNRSGSDEANNGAVGDNSNDEEEEGEGEGASVALASVGDRQPHTQQAPVAANASNDSTQR